MDVDRPPLEFANRVLRRFVNNLYGASVYVLPEDYTMMRVVFRNLGGSWEQVSQGDIEQCKTVVRIVQSWGALREKSRKVEEGY